MTRKKYEKKMRNVRREMAIAYGLTNNRDYRLEKMPFGKMENYKGEIITSYKMLWDFVVETLDGMEAMKGRNY